MQNKPTSRRIALSAIFAALLLFCCGPSLVSALGQAASTTTANDTFLGYGDMKVLRLRNTTRYGSPYQVGLCDLLGKKCDHGISVVALQQGAAELTFKLESRYKRFNASVGIGNSYGGDGTAIFTVSGIDAEGNDVPAAHYTSRSLKFGNKPQEIDISVEGVELLTLTQNSGGADITDFGMVCWGNARVSTVQGSGPGLVVDPSPDGRFILQYEEGKYRPALKELDKKVKDLLKPSEETGAAKAPTLAVSLSKLVSLPERILARKNAEDFENDLRVELGSARTIHLTPSDQTSNQTANEIVKLLKDGVDTKTIIELGRKIAARHLLAYTISDKQTEAAITCELVDLETGLAIPFSVSIPLKVFVPPPPPLKVTLVFNPPQNLRIMQYEWVVDSKTIEAANRRTTTSTRADIERGKHEFVLVWRGQGYPIDTAGTEIAYESVTCKFTAEITDDATIEFRAKVNKPLFVRPTLDLRAFIGGKEVLPKPTH